MMQDTDKRSIRTRLLKQRDVLSVEFCQTASHAIIQQILSMDVFQSAKHIGLYHAFRHEVELTELWRAAYQLEKKTYFPVIASNSTSKDMQFLEASPHETLHLNQFKIKEPHPQSASIDIENLDCLFIPLVGFDPAGYRLGMGQGYYDRALAKIKKKPCCIGVAYCFQEIDSLPHDPWDISLDGVVTEESQIFFNL